MMENVSYTNVQLKVHVQNVCAAFIIIKDKINPRVGISSNNDWKHFHVSFTEVRVRVMGNYFLLTFFPIRLNVHLGAELSGLISA